MTNRGGRFTLGALAGMLLFLGAPAPAVHAQVADDLFTGATIVSSTAGTAQPASLFDGFAADPGSVTFFPDVGAGSEAGVVFDTASVTLAGIRLHAANDGSGLGFRRSMNRFQFFADVNADGSLDASERIVDQSIAVNYDSAQPGDLDTTPQEIEFAFTFPAPVTATRWRVVVTQGVNLGAFDGVRVQEVDAVAAPIGTTLTADPPVQGLLTLRARLTRTTSGAPIAGETVVMSSSGGPICQAVTDSDGVAACSGLAALLQVIGDNGYTASFAGAGQLLPSTAQAALLAPGSGSSPVPPVTTTMLSAAPPVTTTTLPDPGVLAATGRVGWVAPWGVVLLVTGGGLFAGLSALRRRES